MRSGIPASYWRDDLRDAFTAFELYHDEDGDEGGRRRRTVDSG